jgi:hypothetical protein
MAAIGASPRRANRRTAHGAEGRVDIAAARARIMHVLYVGAHGTAVALEDYAKTFAVACALTPKGAGVSNCERLLPEIEAAEAMLSRFEVFEQIAAGGGGTAATPERNLSTAGMPPRVQIEPVSSTPVGHVRGSGV